jgi:hypothetical protein
MTTLPRPTRKITDQTTPPTETEAVPPATKSKYRRRDFKASDRFRFDPLPDITVQELAYLVSILWLDVHFDRFFSFPEHLQRHFRHLKA